MWAPTHISLGSPYDSTRNTRTDLPYSLQTRIHQSVSVFVTRQTFGKCYCCCFHHPVRHFFGPRQNRTQSQCGKDVPISRSIIIIISLLLFVILSLTYMLFPCPGSYVWPLNVKGL